MSHMSCLVFIHCIIGCVAFKLACQRHGAKGPKSLLEIDKRLPVAML